MSKQLKLLSWNVNGIRAAARKGFLDWFAEEDADIVSVQELKAKPEQLDGSLKNPGGYHAFYCVAEKPGYSGVAVYSKTEPKDVIVGMDHEEFDREGRFLAVVFDQFTLVNAYFPHARRDLSRIDFKMAFNHAIAERLDKFKADGHQLILVGDYNVSHQDIDLTHAKANRKNAGFLPIERDWMTDFLASGYHDVFREFHPDEGGHYTWWSNRKGVRERNVGWRIDYHCVAASLRERVTSAFHRKDVLGSDHCPIGMTLSI